MCLRYPIVLVRAPLDPVLVLYSGSNDSIDWVTYIVCLHGQVPKIHELWSLNDQGVREVHPLAQILLLDGFR